MVSLPLVYGPSIDNIDLLNLCLCVCVRESERGHEAQSVCDKKEILQVDFTLQLKAGAHFPQQNCHDLHSYILKYR